MRAIFGYTFSQLRYTPKLKSIDHVLLLLLLFEKLPLEPKYYGAQTAHQAALAGSFIALFFREDYMRWPITYRLPRGL